MLFVLLLKTITSCPGKSCKNKRNLESIQNENKKTITQLIPNLSAKDHPSSLVRWKSRRCCHFLYHCFQESQFKAVNREGPNGPVMSATFELEGQEYYAFNGGPMFTFTEAISLFVKCDTQEKIYMY